MGAFEYSALDGGGRELQGVLEGDSARQIRQQLRDKGWVPLSVDEVVQRKTPSGRGLSLRHRVNATDLALITRQLATLARSGLPLEEALNTVSQQADKPHLKSLLLGVRARVLEGHSLAAGLEDFPHVFPELYRATVVAGEQSGHLDIVLERLADYTEARQHMRQKIMQALLYPTLLTATALLVAGFLLAYVVPQVVQVFEHSGQQLPWLTRALIALSAFLQHHGLTLLLAAAAAGVGLRLLLRNEGVRTAYHRLLLGLPLVARLVRGLNTARLARTLSILSASGVPVLDALNISAQVLSNLPMRGAVTQAALRVREGASIHTALKHSGYFPPMTTQLIASGEASGNLDAMLERAATNQEREVETLIATLMGVFEPALILLMGLLVLVIVLATLLPIFELNQLVK